MTLWYKIVHIRFSLVHRDCLKKNSFPININFYYNNAIIVFVHLLIMRNFTIYATCMNINAMTRCTQCKCAD